MVSSFGIYKSSGSFDCEQNDIGTCDQNRVKEFRYKMCVIVGGFDVQQVAIV